MQAYKLTLLQTDDAMFDDHLARAAKLVKACQEHIKGCTVQVDRFSCILGLTSKPKP